MTDPQLKRAYEHANLFYENGGILSDYKGLFPAYWRELACAGLTDKIFKRRARIKSKPKLLDSEPNLPQEWFTPAIDARRQLGEHGAWKRSM